MALTNLGDLKESLEKAKSSGLKELLTMRPDDYINKVKPLLIKEGYFISEVSKNLYKITWQ